MAGMKNSIRFILDQSEGSLNVVWLAKKILEDMAGVKISDLYCIQEFPRQGTYDVTFFNPGLCLNTFELLKSKFMFGDMKKVSKMQPLFSMQEIPVTIHLYNPYADINLIKTFLGRYCNKVGEPIKQKNILGVFNGKWRFWVRLTEDDTCIGGVRNPPANFTVGGERGFLFYPGQPEFCRTCFRYGHVKEQCNIGKTCRNCNEVGHEARQCTKPRTCDLCNSEGHNARNCPFSKSFASVLFQGIDTVEKDANKNDEGPKQVGNAVSEAMETQTVEDKQVQQKPSKSPESAEDMEERNSASGIIETAESPASSIESPNIQWDLSESEEGSVVGESPARKADEQQSMVAKKMRLEGCIQVQNVYSSLSVMDIDRPVCPANYSQQGPPSPSFLGDGGPPTGRGGGGDPRSLEAQDDKG